MIKQQESSEKAKIIIVLSILLLSTLNSFWMLSKITLTTHECYVSVTAREMVDSGDWLWPTCNGQPRLNKTPLCYWLVAALAKITGEVNELTARFPSAVFALLSAAAILYFVNQWLSFRIAVVSTGIWVTSISYIRYSHNARPDMALAFFVMLCLLSFYSAFTAKSRRHQIIYMLVFWISFGLANLAKGPAPLAYVLIPVFFYVAVSRQWKMLTKLLPFAGPIIFLVIVLPWPLAIAHRLDWNLMVWKHEFIERLYGGYAKGDYPIYYYFGIMFKYITPWFAFLPMALVAPFYKVWEEKRQVMKFLWLWFVSVFVFLTIDVGKRQHYLLPLMPAMAILIGILLEDMIFVRKAFTQRFARNVLKGHIIAIIVGAVGVSIYVAIAESQFLAFVVSLGVITITAVLAVAVLFLRGKPAAACGAIFAGIIIWVMICNTGFLNVLDAERCSRDFARKVAGIIPQTDKLVAYKKVSGRFVQYFGKVVPVIQDKSLLYERYEQGDWVISTFDYLDELTQDDRLKEVYSSKRARREAGNIFGRMYYPKRIRMGKEDTGGVLFHKSTEAIEDEDKSNFKDQPRPGGSGQKLGISQQ